ncbi:MAG: tail fiber protein [Bacteroidia bacterium]|nr:tail fiber protein [Bacteroidia bacterium]
MKKIYFVLLLTAILFAANNAKSQIADGITYQAVVVDENGKEIAGTDINGNIIPDKTVNVRFTILEGNSTGTIVYQETNSVNTDANGLFTLTIGHGQPTADSPNPGILNVSWGSGKHFLKVEIDIKGAGEYKLTGVQQMMAVPYALHTLNYNETDPKWNGLPDQTGDIGRLGNVGIGTLNPTQKLDINGQIRIQGGSPGDGKVLTSGNDGAAVWENISSINLTAGNGLTWNGNTLNSLWSPSGNNIFNNNPGNVGIGVSYPQQNLSVNAGLNIDHANGNDSTTNALTFGSYSGEGIGSRRDTSGDNPFGLDFYTASSNRMGITHDGNVGIGTTAPSSKLHVIGDIFIPDGNSLWVGNNSDSGDRLRFHHSGTDGFIDFATGNLYFRNGTEKMTITSEGNVGIGTTNPKGKLGFRNDSSAITWGDGPSSKIFDNGQLYIETDDNMYFSDMSGNSKMYINTTNGNVGIGTINPGADLEVIGQVKITDGTQGAGKVLTSDASGLASWQTPSVGITGSGTATRIAFWNGASSLSSNANLYWDNSNSRLGIGITSPATKLQVIAASATGIFCSSGNINNWTTIAVGRTIEEGRIGIAAASGNFFGGTVAGDFAIRNDNSSKKLFLGCGTSIPTITLTSTNVGIGTTNPGARLEVYGQVKITDGTQGAGKVLTSDASGLASWSTPVAPIGSIVAWAKSLSGVPTTLPTGWLECNGQVVTDSQSPLYNVTIPDLNGTGGTHRFLRGSTTSGTTGGREEFSWYHRHGEASSPDHWSQGGYGPDYDGNQNESLLPSYYEVVWIMRVK